MPNAKLRILTLSKPYVAAAYRRKLQAWASSGRFEVGLICPPAWGAQAFEPEETPVDAKYWQRTLPIHFNGKNHFHYYKGLAAAVREFRPDVFNVEEEHYSLVTWQAFRIAKQQGAVPLFYTWQNIQKSYPPPFSWIEQYVFHNAGAAIVGNREAGDILRAKGYTGSLHHIPQMGVDLERFAPHRSGVTERQQRQTDLQLPACDLWLGFMGRMVEEKGIQDLLTAMAQRIQIHPTSASRVRLLLVGDGPYLQHLLSLAQTLGIAEQVTHRAFIPSQEVARYLQAIDVLCLPSRTRSNWKEQFGRILIEAMAAEAIVLGSSSGEIPHVIDTAGLTFPEGDSQVLAKQIDRLLMDENLRQDLRRRGASHVRAKYTNTLVAEAFADAFTQAWERTKATERPVRS